jgi:hypothetical protein
MIMFKDNQMVRGGIAGRIDGWTVWFKTPWGFAETLQEAVKACESIKEIDPEFEITPVPVARSGDHYEVCEGR